MCTPNKTSLHQLCVVLLVGGLFSVACAGAQNQPSAPSPPNGAALEVFEGRASYYSDRLAGRSTASGEPYRTEEFTAASRDLPFQSLLRVTRLARDGSAMGNVIVRVNDRGPFGDHSRVLDLSRAAAEQLDMIRAGVISIRVEVLRRGP